MFMHIFMGGPDPDTQEHTLQATTTEETTNIFHVLVNKLQDSLNRLETFEVVTPYQGPIDGKLVMGQSKIYKHSHRNFQICAEIKQECLPSN
jgi:hypothetical protein